MHVRRRLLITFAFFTAVLASVASRPAPSYAVGDIHAIVVHSTTDPALDQVPSFEECLNADFVNLPDFGCYYQAQKRISRDDFTTFRVLEGQDADPRNVAKVCREVSQNAGADDAILVHVQSRAALLPSDSGEERCVLFPLATSEDPNDRGVGLPRATILKNLNVKQHRLVALITGTFEGETNPGGQSIEIPFNEETRIPRPKETPYFVKFLQTARGELNLGYHGKLLSDSQIKWAPTFYSAWTNGLYLESELNPDDFYRMWEKEYYPRSLGRSASGHPYGVLRYNGNKPSALTPFNTSEEWKEFCEARLEKLIDSGEFDGFIEPVRVEPVNDGWSDDDDSDFVPAPDGRSPRSTSDDDDFIPAPGKRSPRSTLDDDDFVPAPSKRSPRSSLDDDFTPAHGGSTF